jgi:putative acetyltransferase
MKNTFIQIRFATSDDALQIGQFIYDTIRTINRKDYDELQVKTWAPDPAIYSTYEDSFAYVADLDGLIVGFANLTNDGYLNRFYIHKDFQNQGIGTLLLNALETKAKALNLNKITTEASITAKPFFLAKGWQIEEQQTVVLRNVSFINYKMHKFL